MGKKALLFWGPAEISDNKVIYYDKRNSQTLRPMAGFSAALALSVLGLLLLATSWAKQRKLRNRSERSLPPPEIQMTVLFLLYVAMCFVAIVGLLKKSLTNLWTNDQMRYPIRRTFCRSTKIVGKKICLSLVR